jgi:flagellar assembly protein FliH
MATVIRAARIDGAPVVLALQPPVPRDRPAAPTPEPLRVEQAPAAAPDPLVHEPPPRTPADAAIQLAQQDSLLRESIAVERQRVLDEARQQGYAAGVEQARADNDGHLQALQQLIGSMRGALSDGIVGAEDLIVEIAFEAVCRIIGDAVGRREGVLAVVREVIRGVRERENLVVRVAPQDYELIAGERQRLLRNGDASRIELVSDERIELGGCLIETAGGTLDGRLETQLQRLRDTLASASRMQPEANP